MEKKLEILRFLLILVVLAVPFRIILQIEPGLGQIQEFVANNVYIILVLMGFSPVQQGYFIFLMEKGLEVAAACIGWRSIYAFLALMVATPRKTHYRKGLLFLPFLYAFNLFRLVTSLLVNVFVPDLFDLVHGFLWTYAMTFLVLGLWWFWVKLRRN
jgi:exosortase/archaeosortase family protein